MIFGPATPEDYPEIEALLAQGDVPGRIGLSFQSDLATGPKHPGAIAHIAIVREDGALIATASRITMPSQQGPLGWIGGFRIAPAYRKRDGLLREGLAAIRAHLISDPPDWQMAAIAKGNLPAHDLLTSRSDYFPNFTPMIAYDALALRPGGAMVAHVRQADVDDTRTIAAMLSQERRGLAPGITANETFEDWPGLQITDFLLAEVAGDVVGLAALWDQRRFARCVVNRYAPALRLSRPFRNAACAMTGLPHLPPVGRPFDMAFLSFLTATDADMACDLIRAGLSQAARKGLRMVALGLALDDPFYPLVTKTFPHESCPSTLFGVTWPGGKNLPPDWHFIQSKVELALL